MTQTEHSLKNILLRMILYTTCWIAGLWGPFHYFLRTRFYFVGSTTFDYTFLVICLLVSWCSILIFYKHPTRLFLSGTIGVEIGAFSAIFTTPVMEDANQTLYIIIVGGIETQMGHISGCIIIGSAFLLLGGMIITISQKFHNAELEKNQNLTLIYEISLSLSLSAFFYWLLSFLFPFNSHMPFHMMALICVIILPLYVYNRFKESDQISHNMAMKKEKMTRKLLIHNILCSTGRFLIWIVYTMLIILLTVFYFHFVDSGREISTALNFFASIGIGGGFLVIWIFCTKKFPLLQKGIAIVVVIICAIVYYQWLLTESSPSLMNILYGIAGAFIIWYFLKHYFDKPSPVGTIGLLFPWIGSAFVAYIPMDTTALLGFQSWIHWVFIGLAIIILFSELLVSKFSRKMKSQWLEQKEVVNNEHK